MSLKLPIVYTAEPESILAYTKKVWRYRALILLFTRQDIKAQYAQTRLSFLWIILRPLTVLGIFTFIFNRVIHVPGLNYPYALFAFTGLIAWNSFSYMVNNAGGVVATNQALIRKVYFPRFLLILSKALTSLVELATSLVLMFLLQLALGYPFRITAIFFPVFVLLNLFIGGGVAVWLSTFSIKYRDLNLFIPNLIGFLIWLTPVFYPATLLPSKVSFLIYFNPVAGVVQGFRWALLGDSFPHVLFLPSFVFMIAFFAAGYYFFVKTENEIADYV